MIDNVGGDRTTMRHTRSLTALLSAMLLCVAPLAGCAPPAPQATSPYPPVPELIPETMPKPPVTADPLIWQPGHWDWTGSGYAWAKGQYVPAQGHGNLWMPGWWSLTPAGWAWQPPHWMG